MTDWVVWPIFSLQALAFALFFFPSSWQLLGVRFKTISISLLIIVGLLIALSLYHDSSQVLNLHF